jgi:DNA-binding CsgD family transcriptional regulator
VCARVQNLLSERQLQVLELVARGYGIKAIATELNLGARTVDWHLMKARRALSASSSAHAVAIAFERGLIRIRQRDLGNAVVFLAVARLAAWTLFGAAFD